MGDTEVEGFIAWGEMLSWRGECSKEYVNSYFATQVQNDAQACSFAKGHILV